MARMIPDVPPDSIHNEGERLVYDALRELPGDYTVIHSFPWLRPDRDLAGAPLREGEADFVILHPQEGMLVLEVKGGTPFLEGGTWYRQRGGVREEMKDPFKQANKNTYALIKEIEEKTGGAVKRRSFVYGYAVFFPNAVERGTLPANSDPTVLFNAHDLGTPLEAISGAFEAWRRERRPLTNATFAAIYNAILPKLRLVRLRAPQLRLDEERLVQLTETQHQLLGSLLTQDRVLIEGVAGSGKTLLAYEAAIQAAIDGKRTLLTCYNRHLADWLRDRRDADPRFTRLSGRLRVAHFHKLAKDLCGMAGVPFEPDGSEHFWKERASDLLLEARLLLDDTDWQPFDALLIDEGQDFLPRWWDALEDLLEDPSTGQLHVFMDMDQSLWPDAGDPTIELPPKRALRVNCRNTRWIAGTSAALAGADVIIPPLAPAGDEPKLINAASRVAQAGLVEQQVSWLVGQGLKPGQIAVIGPAALAQGPLRGRSALAGQPITPEAAEWRAGRGVLVTTARAFKGLEADAVVLYDVDRHSEWFSEADLYVACTRAKHLLIIIAHGDELKRRVKDAVRAAKGAL